MKITKKDAKKYGTYALTGAVGVGVGLAGYAANDTPTKQTQTYQDLEAQLSTVKATGQRTLQQNQEYKDQIAQLETTVTESEEREENLEAQVRQFNRTIEQLRAEKVNLEDAVAQANERVGLVDYLPVFSDEDVEFNGAIATTVDQPVTDGEGDYDRVDVDYTSDDGNYYVTVTEYEESSDADDAVEDLRETANPVEFTEDGDTHTVELTGYTGEMRRIQFQYDDMDATEDVDHEDDIESVTVDGEDITDRVNKVTLENGENDVRVHFDESYYVNDGETVTVSYSDASNEGELKKVVVNWTDFTYDQDSDSREDVYRFENTVVEVEGDRTGDEFEAQYTDLTSQYE